MVLAMAAGVANEGAAMPVKDADANGAAEAPVPMEVDAEVAQPDNSVPTDMAPNGSMGAAAINFRAERREGRLAFDILKNPRVRFRETGFIVKSECDKTMNVSSRKKKLAQPLGDFWQRTSVTGIHCRWHRSILGRTPGFDCGYSLDRSQKACVCHRRQCLDASANQLTFLDWCPQCAAALLELVK